MVTRSDMAKLRDFNGRLDQGYVKFSIPVCDDRRISRWIRGMGLRVVKIIEPIPGVMDNTGHLLGRAGVVWMSFDEQGSRDLWFFHPSDRGVAALFKITWVVK